MTLVMMDDVPRKTDELAVKEPGWVVRRRVADDRKHLEPAPGPSVKERLDRMVSSGAERARARLGLVTLPHPDRLGARNEIHERRDHEPLCGQAFDAQVFRSNHHFVDHRCEVEV